MRQRIDIRAWWSAYGLWTALFIVLLCVYLNTTSGDILHSLFFALSITSSAATAVRLLCNRSAFTRFWRPYVIKWLSWWVANLLGWTLMGMIAIGFILSTFGEPSLWLVVPLITVPPTLRLLIHAGRDIRSVRWLRDARLGGLKAITV